MPMAAMFDRQAAGQGLYQYSSEFALNVPDRVNVYLSSQYEQVQERVINFASRAIYFFGFTDLEMTVDTLQTFYNARFFSLFLGLVLTIVLTAIFILSTLLLYSLLLISVESRNFEIAVHARTHTHTHTHTKHTH